VTVVVAARASALVRSPSGAQPPACRADLGCEIVGISVHVTSDPAVDSTGGAPDSEVWVNEADDSVTGLIHAWTAGDRRAGDQLFTRVYSELRTIARRLHRAGARDADDTLDTTALVHEVYLRLAGASALSIQNRSHFFALVVRASRQVIMNYARDVQALKRGGTAVLESLEAVDAMHGAGRGATDEFIDQVVALDGALRALEQLHPRPCRVVECRFFGGLSIADTALALDISEATVKRDWSIAQAWLHRALREAGPGDAG
jgi:RNA polymerase sigma factor (TIGR02999 family)